MEVQNNSAGRLYEILKAAKKSNQNAALRSVWSSALGCTESDTAELLRLWGELIRLSGQAKKEVEAVDNINATLYLSAFTAVEKALAKVNFDRPWHEVRDIFDERTMIGLEYASELLRRESAATLLVTDDQLSILMAELDRILGRVLESELPEKLKQLFARNLEQLRQALVGIRISGAEGLEQEIDRALGSVIRHTELIQQASTADEDNAAVVKDYFGLLGKFNDTVTFGQNLAMLAAPAVPVLAHLLN